jgi:hypothetical protein
MKKFWIIDGSCEEYATKDEAVAAAKRRAAFLAKNPPQSYPFCLQNVDDDTVYVYEAVAIARTPTPNIEVEEIS